MKNSLSKLISIYLPGVLLVTSLAVIYLHTLAPGLTWANGGSDGGDLITAAATGGVAHPTGYPLYLILARLFQFIPVGSLAFRTNLMSALFTACAAGLLYSVVADFLSSPNVDDRWLPGMAAGYAFGLAPLIWSQAVITEVYALQSFLVLLILYLYTRSANQTPKQISRWRGLALGLGTANHVTTLLFLPMALLLGYVRAKRESPSLKEWPWFRHLKFDALSLRDQLIWFVIGLSPYLILPLRALAQPPVNWGDAVTPERFWWLVSGQLYQSYYLQFDLAGLWERIRSSAALLLEQFGPLGVLLGLLGLMVFGSRSRLQALTIWIAITSLAFSLIYHSDDSYVYLIPMVISFAIWIGLGNAGLIKALSLRQRILGLSLGFVLIGYFLVRSVFFARQVDASGDLRAETFGNETLAALPKDAMIFAKGDEAIFALWYFHFALKERPDLAVMASDLLHFDWYQETLRATYPSLAVPGPFPFPETLAAANPGRPACSVQYMERAEIQCSQPLVH